MHPKWLAVSAVSVVLSACTLHHSKVVIPDGREIQIEPDAKFVTSDDSGLAILGLLVVSEPDHYAVLVERIRRRYNCASIHHAQLDFYSDNWLFVSFPIARVTAICDLHRAAEPAMPSTTPAPPAPVVPPASAPSTVPPPLGPPSPPT